MTKAKYIIMWSSEGIMKGFHMDKSKASTPQEFDTPELAIEFIERFPHIFLTNKPHIAQVFPIEMEVKAKL